MTEESSDQLSWKVAWKDVIASAVPLLTVLGMAFYALSTYAYGHFYSSLGTTPADVGLTYVGILAVSTGWAIALALGLAFVIAVVFAWFPAIRLGGMVGEHLRMGELFVVPYRHAWPMLRSTIRDREWRLPKEEQEARWNAREAELDAILEREQAWRDRILHTEVEPGTKLGQLWADGVIGRWFVRIVVGLCLFFLVIDPIHHTFQFADQVKAGHAGSASAGLFGLPLVRLRANEVRVASAGKAGEFPAVDRLSGRRLIYLGEANSKAMLYDPIRRVTFSVPAASLVLELRGG
jgi:hypothetical protein